MRIIAATILGSLSGASLVLAQAPDGYPRNPDIDVLNYRFHLQLSDASNEILGRTEVEIRFPRAGVTSIALDLIGKAADGGQTGMQVSSVAADAANLDFLHEGDRLTISMARPSQAQERRSYSIEYRGVPADGLVIGKNKHGERAFFGDNFSTRFRHWLVGVDHPYDKASCEFLVTAPDHYQVIANGILAEESDMGPGMRRTHWRQSVPISTYLMVIGVARFAVQHLETYQGIPIQTWVYPQDREAGFYDFALAKGPLAFYSSHVGPYPYAKLANVQSRTKYGGMENASSIFYSEQAISGERRNANTVTHEIAHQWFGNSVTEADWTQVWLSEGFATYFTQLYNEFTYGRDRMVAGMRSSRDRVTAYWHTDKGMDSPVVDTRVPADQALTHGTNVYQKGSWVLHMLRHRVGDQAFWAGIREYYRRYRDGNALTADLRRVFEEVSGQDLEVFFGQWIFQPGHPIFAGEWSYDEDRREVVIDLQQVQSTGLVFVTELEIGIRDDAGMRVVIAEIDAAEQSLRFPATKEPEEVQIDPRVWLLMESRITRR